MRVFHICLVEAVVNGIEIITELHLRVHGEVVEQNRLRPQKEAPVLPSVGAPLVGVRGPILALITANKRESLDDRVFLIFIEAGCFLEPLLLTWLP